MKKILIAMLLMVASFNQGYGINIRTWYANNPAAAKAGICGTIVGAVAGAGIAYYIYAEDDQSFLEVAKAHPWIIASGVLTGAVVVGGGAGYSVYRIEQKKKPAQAEGNTQKMDTTYEELFGQNQEPKDKHFEQQESHNEPIVVDNETKTVLAELARLVRDAGTNVPYIIDNEYLKLQALFAANTHKGNNDLQAINTIIQAVNKYETVASVITKLIQIPLAASAIARDQDLKDLCPQPDHA
ncbi:MAG: hypothetical protein WCT20_01555 [Candidatus Babeliales bacterium]|jgi:phosphate/sulfate permease